MREVERTERAIAELCSVHQDRSWGGTMIPSGQSGIRLLDNFIRHRTANHRTVDIWKLPETYGVKCGKGSASVEGGRTSSPQGLRLLNRVRTRMHGVWERSAGDRRPYPDEGVFIGHSGLRRWSFTYTPFSFRLCAAPMAHGVAPIAIASGAADGSRLKRVHLSRCKPAYRHDTGVRK